MNSGYDISTDTYSPEGRVFQIEYAAKAVDLQGTAIGICCNDGVVVGMEKLLPSNHVEKSALQRVFSIDKHCGVCIAGSQPDGLMLVRQAREECASYRRLNGKPILGPVLAMRLSEFLHLFTLYGSYRPLGCAAILATYGDDGPKLSMIEPSGVSTQFMACAAGKAKTEAKSELEKIDFSSITCTDAVALIQKILHSLHDSAKDKYFHYEIGWISKETDKVFQLIADELLVPYSGAPIAEESGDMNVD
ncbi:proteasome alpha 7 subunit [Perkinsela sp. CCAP 1560/4]|nr:proteasome alpha 7 subunit [Perkinsela sp. CCAP 1560/4]|eukprot:KNH08245.1 proteasome alpha 7 subunit [Perkinsela sp. CCAP 1560/4]